MPKTKSKTSYLPKTNDPPQINETSKIDELHASPTIKYMLNEDEDTTDTDQGFQTRVESLGYSDSTSARKTSGESQRSEDHKNQHKLAERRRRLEMKKHFEGLRDSLPRTTHRASKYELLESSIEYIDFLATEHLALNQKKINLIKEVKRLRLLETENQAEMTES